MYKITNELYISDKDTENNMLLSCCHWPPKDITENLTPCLASIFQRVQNEKKKSFMIGNFSLNCLKYNIGRNIKHFTTNLFLLLASLQAFVKIVQQ